MGGRGFHPSEEMPRGRSGSSGERGGEGYGPGGFQKDHGSGYGLHRDIQPEPLSVLQVLMLLSSMLIYVRQI